MEKAETVPAGGDGRAGSGSRGEPELVTPSCCAGRSVLLAISASPCAAAAAAELWLCSSCSCPSWWRVRTRERAGRAPRGSSEGRWARGRGQPRVGGSGAGAAVRAAGGGLAPAVSLSVLSLGQPVAAGPGGLAGTGPGGAGLGCVGAPEPASTFRLFEKGASSCLTPASSASGGASEDRKVVLICLVGYFNQLMNCSPLRRGRCPSCP